MIVVQVIGPPNTQTPRHEFHYPDGMIDEAILADMKTPDDKGRVKADIIGQVLVWGTDPESGRSMIVPAEGRFVIDDPETVIAVGELYWEKGQKLFRETRRLKGPPL